MQGFFPPLCVWWSCCPGAHTLYAALLCKNRLWLSLAYILMLLTEVWERSQVCSWGCVFPPNPASWIFLIHRNKMDFVLCVYPWPPVSNNHTNNIKRVSGPWTGDPLCIALKLLWFSQQEECLVASVCFPSVWWDQGFMMLFAVLASFPAFPTKKRLHLIFPGDLESG